MPIAIGDGLSFCGRASMDSELRLIRGITHEFANLAWTELAATVCELLQWRRPNGGLKTGECYLFLRELHRRGWLPWLTASQPRSRRPARPLSPMHLLGYRVANWREVGTTQGRGRMYRGGHAEGIRKRIFLYPLRRNWRQRLCAPPPEPPT
jgi:hypothetical protein